MSENKEVEMNGLYLEFEKQIWTIFSIGVTASVVILYQVISSPIFESNPIFKNLALILGFSILVFCFFTICGYNYKKKSLPPTDFGKRLDKMFFLRSRWMGEIILILIWGFYMKQYYDYYGLIGICIGLTISISAMSLSFIANYLKKLTNLV